MKIIKADITEIETGVIIQQVNCQNSMGAGLSRAIYEKWPIVKTKYHEFYNVFAVNHPRHADLMLLGQYHSVIVQSKPKIEVINVFGQLEFGRDGRFTDYAALKKAFKCISLHKKCKIFWDDEKNEELPFYIPRFLGAGLGGGDCKIIHRLIELYLPDAILVDY